MDFTSGYFLKETRPFGLIAITQNRMASLRNLVLTLFPRPRGFSAAEWITNAGNNWTHLRHLDVNEVRKGCAKSGKCDIEQTTDHLTHTSIPETVWFPVPCRSFSYFLFFFATARAYLLSFQGLPWPTRKRRELDASEELPAKNVPHSAPLF